MLQDDGGRDNVGKVPEVLGWLLAATAATKLMSGVMLGVWINPMIKAISGRAGLVQVPLASSPLQTQLFSLTEVSFICPSLDLL